jgi:hypothetical protein
LARLSISDLRMFFPFNAANVNAANGTIGAAARRLESPAATWTEPRLGQFDPNVLHINKGSIGNAKPSVGPRCSFWI